MDLKQGLSKQITRLNVKTSFFLEENKIRTYITTLENEIKELKMTAGETGFAKWTTGEDASAELSAIYAAIAEKYTIIQEQEKLIQEIAERGKQVLGAAPAAEGAAYFCPSCGEKYEKAPNFCVKCGTKLR